MARAAGKALVVVGLARTASTLAAGSAVTMVAQLVALQLVRAAHGDSSGVRGAAWLWE